MTDIRPVEDVYPVLKQWAFVATESVKNLDSAIDQFYAARHALNEARRSSRAEHWAAALGAEERSYENSIYRIQGASFFLVSAASQVVRVIENDPSLGDLPGGLNVRMRTLRDVLEHWDDWTKEKIGGNRRTSGSLLRDADPDAWPFGWVFTPDDFVVAGQVPLAELRSALGDLWGWLESQPASRSRNPSADSPRPYPLVARSSP
ncbi:hypothetical protein LG324_06840 [Phycicoccus jejuensis]|uniref:hypothetical protein n=1 Tax=Phycicoccus jejuensis TaxID=367299 RepID=UPI00384F4CEC